MAKSKYKAKKIVVDGIKFDSIAEGDYFYKLKKMKLVGEIKDFEMQPKYTVQEKFTHPTEGNIRAIVYKADFAVVLNGGDYYIVDVKGQSTPVALIKRKMFLQKYKYIDLRWVAKSKKYGENGWIDYFKLERIRKANRKKKQALVKQGEL